MQGTKGGKEIDLDVIMNMFFILGRFHVDGEEDYLMNWNKEISQEEHISLLQQHKKKDTAAISAQINSKYIKYVNGEDDLLESIIEDVDKKFRGMLIHQLYVAGCYNDENEHTAIQEARLAVWKKILEGKKEHNIEMPFADICKGIYYHKVMDVVRSVLTERTRYGEDYVDPKVKKKMKEKGHVYQGGIESLDRILPSENGTVGSMLADTKYDGNRPESVIDDAEKRQFFDTAFEMFCEALTNTNAEPPRGLAYYYSRILPHILHIYFSVETIPDTKAASPKWAIEKMGVRSIGVLSDESEKQLKEYVSNRLVWCDAFRKQLDDEVATFSGMQVMRDIIYVNQYDEKQIGHMADYMHGIIASTWIKLMKKNPKATENAVEYTVGSDKISKALRGGLGR